MRLGNAMKKTILPLIFTALSLTGCMPPSTKTPTTPQEHLNRAAEQKVMRRW